MEIHSIARMTDQMIAKHTSEVIDRKDYVVIKTIDNPTYRWGNYILFSKAPKDSDAEQWPAIYREEFKDFESINHMTFTWDTATETRGATKRFTEQGFKLEQGTGYRGVELTKPEKFNSELQVKKIVSDDEWEATIKLQILSNANTFGRGQFEVFKRRQMAAYKKMIDLKKGIWFGAYLENELVGDLGILYEGDLGRYQSIETHPSYRRIGISRTLIYQAGEQVQKDFGVKQLVLESEAQSQASRVYESVGFVPVEKNFSLTWTLGP
jgi:GNAT superfamily N-acetyltransferase